MGVIVRLQKPVACYFAAPESHVKKPRECQENAAIQNTNIVGGTASLLNVCVGVPPPKTSARPLICREGLPRAD